MKYFILLTSLLFVASATAQQTYRDLNQQEIEKLQSVLSSVYFPNAGIENCVYRYNNTHTQFVFSKYFKRTGQSLRSLINRGYKVSIASEGQPAIKIRTDRFTYHNHGVLKDYDPNLSTPKQAVFSIYTDEDFTMVNDVVARVYQIVKVAKDLNQNMLDSNLVIVEEEQDFFNDSCRPLWARK